MKTSWTKSFDFSASYADGPKVIGRNYRLSVTLEGCQPSTERTFQECIEKELIQKLHSRDLSLHVDFLKGSAMDEPTLLRHFWPIVEKACQGATLVSLGLERDQRTRWMLSAGRGEAFA